MKNFLEVALTAIKQAEEIIMGAYPNKIDFTTKEDNSRVTLLDKKSEQTMINHISSNFPDHGFFGEEFGKKNEDAEYVWVMDPIDGTHNFLRHIPFFGIELALTKNKEVILGISDMPAFGELMWATKGGGTYLNRKKVGVSNISNINQSFFATGKPHIFEKKGHLNGLLNLSKNCYDFRSDVGELTGGHFVAQGKIEINIRPEILFWDIAALKIIIEEAGGKMTDFLGNPVDENTREIISTNGLLHNKVLEFFQ